MDSHVEGIATEIGKEISQVRLFHYNPGLKKDAMELYRSVASMQLPQKMEKLAQQITDIRNIDIKHLEDALAGDGAERNSNEAHNILDRIDRKIFGNNKLWTDVTLELTQLQDSFGGNGKEKIRLAKAIADIENAATSRMKVVNFFLALQHTGPLSDYMKPKPFFGFLACAICPFTWFCSKNKALALVSFGAVSYGGSLLENWALGSCETFEQALAMTAKEKIAATEFSDQLYKVGLGLKTASKQIESLHDRREPLSHLNECIDTIAFSNYDFSLMSVNGLIFFLKAHDLGHLADNFAKHHIDGSAFLDILGADGIRKMISDDETDVRRILLLQEKASKQVLRRESTHVHELIGRVKHYIDVFEADVYNAKGLVEQWKFQWLNAHSSVPSR